MESGPFAVVLIPRFQWRSFSALGIRLLAPHLIAQIFRSEICWQIIEDGLNEINCLHVVIDLNKHKSMSGVYLLCHSLFVATHFH